MKNVNKPEASPCTLLHTATMLSSVSNLSPPKIRRKTRQRSQDEIKEYNRTRMQEWRAANKPKRVPKSSEEKRAERAERQRIYRAAKRKRDEEQENKQKKIRRPLQDLSNVAHADLSRQFVQHSESVHLPHCSSSSSSSLRVHHSSSSLLSAHQQHSQSYKPPAFLPPSSSIQTPNLNLLPHRNLASCLPSPSVMANSQMHNLSTSLPLSSSIEGCNLISLASQKKKGEGKKSLLEQHNLPTSLISGGQKLLSELVTEIEGLIRSENKKNQFIDFRVASNVSKTRRACFIPQFSSTKGFKNWADYEGHTPIKSMLNFCGNGVKSQETEGREPQGAYFFIDYLAKTYPETFGHVAKKNVPSLSTIPRRLNTIETASLLRNVCIAPTALFNLSSYFSVYFGGPLVCTQEELYAQFKRRPELSFGTFEYFKKESKKKMGGEETDDEMGEEGPEEEMGNEGGDEGVVKKKKAPEIVKYVKLDGVQALEMEFERHIQFEIIVKKRTRPTFGSYGIECDENGRPRDVGQYVISGTDHGGDFSQTAARILTTSSVERRTTGCADYGQFTIMLMQIQCKKDPMEILELTRDTMNDFVRTLKTHKAVAVMDRNITVRCKMVPIMAKDFRCVDGTTLEYDLEGYKVSLPLDYGLDRNDNQMEIWDVMGKSRLKKLCDLSALFSLDGRDGHSSCKCAFCDLSQSEWKEGSRKGTRITSAILETHFDMGVPNPLGVKTKQVWNIDPWDNIPPPLHIGIGAGNNVRDRLQFLALTEVDCGDAKEKAKLIAEDDANKGKENLKREMDNLKKRLKSEQEGLRQLKKERGKIDGSIRNRTKTLQKYQPDHRLFQEREEAIALLHQRRNPLQQQISLHEKSIEEVRNDITRVESDIQKFGAKAYQLRCKINKLQKERKRRDGGADVAIDDILQNENIPVKVWHGTSMTYGACRDLMTKCEKVMPIIEDDWIRRIRKRNKDQNQEHEACRSFTEEEVKQVIGKFKDLLLVQDVLMSHVRVINPTWKEVKRVRRAIKLLKKLIPDVGLSETPKVHCEYEHLVEEMIRLGGLGDKVEEWLEKIHQMFKRMRYLTQRMSTGWNSQMSTIHMYMWRNSDPFVVHEAERVKKALERNLSKNKKKSKAEQMDDRREQRWNKLLGIQAKYLTTAEIAEDECTEDDDRFVYNDEELVCTVIENNNNAN